MHPVPALARRHSAQALGLSSFRFAAAPWASWVGFVARRPERPRSTLLRRGRLFQTHFSPSDPPAERIPCSRFTQGFFP